MIWQVAWCAWRNFIWFICWQTIMPCRSNVMFQLLFIIKTKLLFCTKLNVHYILNNLDPDVLLHPLVSYWYLLCFADEVIFYVPSTTIFHCKFLLELLNIYFLLNVLLERLNGSLVASSNKVLLFCVSYILLNISPNFWQSFEHSHFGTLSLWSFSENCFTCSAIILFGNGFEFALQIVRKIIRQTTLTSIL